MHCVGGNQTLNYSRLDRNTWLFIVVSLGRTLLAHGIADLSGDRFNSCCIAALFADTWRCGDIDISRASWKTSAFLLRPYIILRIPYFAYYIEWWLSRAMRGTCEFCVWAVMFREEKMLPIICTVPLASVVLEELRTALAPGGGHAAVALCACLADTTAAGITRR